VATTSIDGSRGVNSIAPCTGYPSNLSFDPGLVDLDGLFHS
jgi:hypothetical protein